MNSPYLNTNVGGGWGPPPGLASLIALDRQAARQGAQDLGAAFMQLGAVLDSQRERAKQESALAKSAEAFVKANPAVLQQMGMMPEQFANLGARDKAAAVEGVIKANHFKEFAERLTALQQQNAALQQETESARQAAPALGEFARLLSTPAPLALAPGAIGPDGNYSLPGALSQTLRQYPQADPRTMISALGQFAGTMPRPASPLDVLRAQTEMQGVANQARALDLQAERIELDRNPPVKPPEPPRVNIVRDPTTGEDRVSVTLSLDDAQRLGFSVPGLSSSQPATQGAATPAKAPAIGTIVRGYRYIGPDPALPSSWQKVN